MFEWGLFAIPQAFTGIHKIRQLNAVTSWSCLSPRPEITLYCNDADVGKVALEYGDWVSHIDRNSHGTPLVGSAFMSMQEYMPGVLCYVNSDIILMQDFVETLEIVSKEFDRFLMVGQRWDIDINRLISFEDDWELNLLIMLERKGKLHQPGGMDYFAFSSGLFIEFPPFAVGRVRWDNWVMSNVVTRGIPTIDVSLVTTVVHQDVRGIHQAETDEDRQYVSLYDRTKGRVAGNITDSTWILDENGFHKR